MASTQALLTVCCSDTEYKCKCWFRYNKKTIKQSNDMYSTCAMLRESFVLSLQGSSVHLFAEGGKDGEGHHGGRRERGKWMQQIL